MSAVSTGALNPGDTFRVVSTINETFDRLLDVDDPVFAVFFRVLGVVVFFKGFEMVLKDLLNDILFPWFITRQTALQNPLPYINQEIMGFDLYCVGKCPKKEKCLRCEAGKRHAPPLK